MTTRQARRAAARMAAKNGATETTVLSETQVAQLQQLMQPLLLQWQISKGVVTGFLTCARIPNNLFTIDMSTGIVSLVQPQQPSANGADPPGEA